MYVTPLVPSFLYRRCSYHDLILAFFILLQMSNNRVGRGAMGCISALLCSLVKTLIA